MFFILLIGMISLTSMASTSLTEQKQKTTFCMDVLSPVVGIVVNECQVTSVLIDAAQLNDINVMQLKNVAEPETSLAIITDVGWQNSNVNYNKIPFTEKFIDKNLIKSRNRLINNFRNYENQFISNPIILYNRIC